ACHVLAAVAGTKAVLGRAESRPYGDRRTPNPLPDARSPPMATLTDAPAPPPATGDPDAPDRFVPWAAELGQRFAEHAARHDRDGTFVEEAFDVLRSSGYLTLAVPT